MLLSIIVPYHNGGATIKRCLHSLTASLKVRHYEVLVVDDGSCLADGNLLRTFLTEKSFPQVRLLPQDHGGAAAARNAGIAAAQGDYLWMVDADDYVAGGSVDLMMDLLLSLPAAIDLIKLGPMMTGERTFHSRQDSLAAEAEALLAQQDWTTVPPLSLLAPQSSCLDHTTYLYRRSFLSAAKLSYPQRMCLNEDSLFVLHCLQRAGNALPCPQLRLYYLDRSQRSTTRGRWSEEQSRRFTDDCILFFSELRSCCAQGNADAATGARMKALYDRYLYVYCRVLAVKCCPWQDLLRFRRQAAVPGTFFFSPASAALPARLLAHPLAHRLFRQCCRLLRATAHRPSSP